MNIGKKLRDTVKINTLIDEKTKIEGNISGDGNYKIDGKLNGNISVSGDVVVDEKAVITGDITAVNIIAAGTVNGNITADGQLTVKSTAVLNGNGKTCSIVIEDGASVNGNYSIEQNSQEEPSDEEQ